MLIRTSCLARSSGYTPPPNFLALASAWQQCTASSRGMAGASGQTLRRVKVQRFTSRWARSKTERCAAPLGFASMQDPVGVPGQTGQSPWRHGQILAPHAFRVIRAQSLVVGAAAPACACQPLLFR